ncbi:MAG: hypothetical protein OXG98_11105 [Gemmatimonadetes bacterium]|nr:hypothetical protein [Gemmatimonadota bacterium]
MAQYIAASITLHANDGWSYLGRAIGCLLTGDTHRALHLAYYAELRAAMSLLAGFGIGIFDHQHFIVAQANSTAKLHTRLGTHRMVWLALEEWAKLPSSGKIFAELVRPEGYDLDEWFQLHGGASKLAPQARAWFLQWGMDLRLASKDRYARNESSYRPDGVPITWQADPTLCLNFVRDMWTLLEPSSTSSFEQIDRHIFRLSIERYFRGLTGKPNATGDPAFVALVGKTVSRLGLPHSAEKRIKDFLCRKVSAADPLVFRYSSHLPGTPETDALAVVSRAVLLLRLATGSAHRLLQRTSINAKDLAFWWQSLGENRGIWPPGTPPAEPYDLWADVKESLDAVAQIEEKSRPPLDSFSSIATGLAPQLTVLASHERVGIWGLCPS